MVIEMMKTSRTAIVIVLAALVAMVAPVSAVMYRGGLGEGNRTEMYIEIAERAGDRVQNLIDLISVNTTAIEDAGLLDEFEGNVTLFGEALGYIDEASSSLAASDYETAVASATEALGIFKEVLKSIHIIMQESGISSGGMVVGQGLLLAMDRALERIERLREILDNVDPDNVTEEVLALLDEAETLLDEAETYLNKDTAISWLLEGKVTDTALNLTKANDLISNAHRILKDLAVKSNIWRIQNYLQQMVRARERLRERLQYAGGEGIDVNGVLNQLGYENMNEFVNALQEMAQSAREAGNIRDALGKLIEIGQTIRQLDRALTQQMYQYRQQNGPSGGTQNNGQMSSGAGYGQDSGSMQGNGGSGGN